MKYLIVLLGFVASSAVNANEESMNQYCRQIERSITKVNNDLNDADDRNPSLDIIERNKRSLARMRFARAQASLCNDLINYELNLKLDDTNPSDK
jgi:hypothetical protein